MRAVSVSMMSLLAGLIGFSGPVAAQDQTDKWKSGHWSGATHHFRGNFATCSATYFDTAEDTSFTLDVIGNSFKTFTMTNTSVVYVYFTDDGLDTPDGPEEKGFSAWLEGKTVTLAIGKSYRGPSKVVEPLVHSFRFEAPMAIIDAFAAGGPLTLQMPKGKPYFSKVPPSSEAMAYFKKCLAANQGR